MTCGAAATAIVGGTLVNVETGASLANSVVLIEAGRIIAIGAAGTIPVPADAHVIQAQGKWLLPGMIDMHVHLGLVLPSAEGLRQSWYAIYELLGIAWYGLRYHDPLPDTRPVSDIR